VVALEFWTGTPGDYTIKAHGAATLKIGGGAVSASYTINSSGLSLSTSPTPSFTSASNSSSESSISVAREDWLVTPTGIWSLPPPALQ